MDSDDLEGFFDFGQVRSTKLGPSNGVLVTLRGTEGDAGNEEASDCELWTVAGIASRPTDASSDHAEALFFRQSDQLLGFASRDRRYIVAVEKGELAIHALAKDGATQAVVRLKPNGEVIVEGASIKLGGAAASEAFIRGNEFLAALAVFATALNGAATIGNVAAAGGALKAYLDGGTAASTVIKGV